MSFLNTEKQNVLLIEDVNEELRNLEKQISKIYYELYDNSKDISYYRMSQLLRRIKLMNVRVSELIEIEVNKNFRNNLLVIGGKIIALLILGLFLMALISPFGILLLPILLYLDYSFVKESRDLKKIYDNNIKERTKLINDYKNIFNNCKNKLVKVFSEKSSEIKDKINKKEKDLFELANGIIVGYINGRDNYNLITDEVSVVIRSILQDDLKVEEKDLKTLLNMAKEKNSIEYIKREFGIKRKVLESEL